jgi:hypothetical protein
MANDSAPERCEYPGHEQPAFPSRQFRPRGRGWEHIGQDTPHLASGRLIVPRPSIAGPKPPRRVVVPRPGARTP